MSAQIVQPILSFVLWGLQNCIWNKGEHDMYHESLDWIGNYSVFYSLRWLDFYLFIYFCFWKLIAEGRVSTSCARFYTFSFLPSHCENETWSFKLPFYRTLSNIERKHLGDNYVFPWSNDISYALGFGCLFCILKWLHNKMSYIW